MIGKASEALLGIEHEIIVVDDDSPDGTWKIAQELARQHPNVRVVRRMGRRGLSSAVIEGFLTAKGDVLAVADADGQHDLSLLSKLYNAVKESGGIAVGSRYTQGGSVGQWDERRHAMSQIATALAMRLCRVKVSDPMSGYFALDRRTFEEVLPRLNPMGFKILLDLLVHVPSGTPATEVPFTFGARLHGESKLSRRVQIEFLEYLYDAAFGRIIPLTFIEYVIVGTLGVLVNLVGYFTTRFLLGESSTNLVGFSVPLLAGIEAAILFNFFLNNAWTFGHARLRGWSAIIGLARYNVVCAFGALANYAVTTYLFVQGMTELMSLIVGAFIGMVWNYTMSRLFTWKT